MKNIRFDNVGLVVILISVLLLLCSAIREMIREREKPLIIFIFILLGISGLLLIGDIVRAQERRYITGGWKNDTIYPYHLGAPVDTPDTLVYNATKGKLVKVYDNTAGKKISMNGAVSTSQRFLLDSSSTTTVGGTWGNVVSRTVTFDGTSMTLSGTGDARIITGRKSLTDSTAMVRHFKIVKGKKVWTSGWLPTAEYNGHPVSIRYPGVIICPICDSLKSREYIEAGVQRGDFYREADGSYQLTISGLVLILRQFPQFREAIIQRRKARGL